MAEKMMLTEDQALELFTFFITSARTQLEDPCNYASMRLLTGAEILRDFIIERVSPAMQEMLTGTLDKTEYAQIIMNDEDAFTESLDDLCATVARYLVQRNGLEENVS